MFAERRWVIVRYWSSKILLRHYGEKVELICHVHVIYEWMLFNQSTFSPAQSCICLYFSTWFVVMASNLSLWAASLAFWSTLITHMYKNHCHIVSPCGCLFKIKKTCWFHVHLSWSWSLFICASVNSEGIIPTFLARNIFLSFCNTKILKCKCVHGSWKRFQFGTSGIVIS